jgi:uncharacterized Zn finger protein (UPF0148 family)
MAERTVTRLSWYKCYKERWGQEIVPEAYGHPAKFARGLIRRIYEHALEQGYLRKGDTVLDPFGGVALGAADALANGLNFVGVELEQNFVDLGSGCDCTGISKADWAACFRRWKWFAHTDGRHWCPRCLAEAGVVLEEWEPVLPGMEAPVASYGRSSGKIPHTEPHRYGGNLALFARRAQNGATAVLMQGDSRRLVEVLEGARAEGVITSPPRARSLGSQDVDFRAHGLAEKAGEWKQRRSPKSVARLTSDYGTDPANLGNMPTGEPPSVIVSSPPFTTSDNRGAAKMPDDYFVRADGTPFGEGKAIRGTLSDNEGQLGTIPTGEPPQAVIASPPHIDSLSQGNKPEGYDYTRYGGGGQLATSQRYGKSDGQLGTMRDGDVDAVIASPPYIDSMDSPEKCGVDWEKAGRPDRCKPSAKRISPQVDGGMDYGRTDGQLAQMREGDVDAVIASPPWAQAQTGGGIVITGTPKTGKLSKTGGYRADMQGISDGQLAALPEGEPPRTVMVDMRCPYCGSPLTDGDNKGEGLFCAECGEVVEFVDAWECVEESPAAIVSSPPWEKSSACEDPNYRTDRQTSGGPLYNDYGDHPDQLGNTAGDTFWSAAKKILLQCHAVLLPGGVAIFVTKRFVRDKKIIEFSQQWADLCQSCGFELIEWIKAWLVEERGTQYDLEGKAHTKTVKRFSFFRRLHAQKYPHLAIEWEDVLIFRKLQNEP